MDLYAYNITVLRLRSIQHSGEYLKLVDHVSDLADVKAVENDHFDLEPSPLPPVFFENPSFLGVLETMKLHDKLLLGLQYVRWARDWLPEPRTVSDEAFHAIHQLLITIYIVAHDQLQKNGEINTMSHTLHVYFTNVTIAIKRAIRYITDYLTCPMKERESATMKPLFKEVPVGRDTSAEFSHSVEAPAVVSFLPSELEEDETAEKQKGTLHTGENAKDVDKL